MSETLVNPRILLGQLARELPPELHDQVFLAGSLAAACHHAARLSGGGVRTKDADLVVRPSGNTAGAQTMRASSSRWAGITAKRVDLRPERPTRPQTGSPPSDCTRRGTRTTSSSS